MILINVKSNSIMAFLVGHDSIELMDPFKHNKARLKQLKIKKKKNKVTDKGKLCDTVLI